jgi:hypothetical protein
MIAPAPDTVAAMSYHEIGSGWGNATAMATLDGNLYIIDNGTLYRVDHESGEYTEISSGWDGATLMTAMNGHLWVVHSGTLYRIDHREE